MQPQNKGPGMLWGQSYVLPMTWGGVEAYGGAPFGRHAALRLFHLRGGLLNKLNWFLHVLPITYHMCDMVAARKTYNFNICYTLSS